ncbi:hypothetical protein [Herbaspirillum sp. RV1423]|uniref:hypothetical protein n=1 Tax=Herbaspirillum sp. RV1423 TaxID=1443993 RepID=UPI0004B6D0BA|nr:hypothetical protein [Herbaspirillum sp. RV1423]
MIIIAFAFVISLILYRTRTKHLFLLTKKEKFKKALLQTTVILVGAIVLTIIKGREFYHYGIPAPFLTVIAIGFYLVTYRQYRSWTASKRAFLRTALATVVLVAVGDIVLLYIYDYVPLAATVAVPFLLIALRTLDKWILGWANLYRGVALTPTHYVSERLEIRLNEIKEPVDTDDPFELVPEPTVFIKFKARKKKQMKAKDENWSYEKNGKLIDVVETLTDYQDFEGNIPCSIFYLERSEPDQIQGNPDQTTFYIENLRGYFAEKKMIKTGQVTTTSVIDGGTSFGYSTNGDMVLMSNPSRTITHYGETYQYKVSTGLYFAEIYFHAENGTHPLKIEMGLFDKKSVYVLGGVVNNINEKTKKFRNVENI